MFLLLETPCDQQANTEKQATLLQHTMSAMLFAGRVHQLRVLLQAELGSAVASCGDSPDVLSSQSTQTTAPISEHNKNFMPYYSVIFTVTPDNALVC